MAADIFRERSDNDIRTKRQGRLIERAEKRIIDNERQSAAISGQMLSEGTGCCNIDDAVRRIGGRFDINGAMGPDFRALSAAICMASTPPSVLKATGQTPNCGRIFFNRKSVPP